MKKFGIIACLLSVFFWSLTSFDHAEDQPGVIVKKRLENRLQAYKTSLLKLKRLAEDLNNDKGSVLQLQEQYKNVRSSFKSWEYLAEYVDPVFMKENINGAPLPKLERNSFGLNVIEPMGMQILDEAIYADNIFEEKQEIVKETEWLYERLAEFNMPVFMYDRNVFEGVRTGLVRLFTLGLTGFDVPGSASSVSDASTVLQTMWDDISLYLPILEKENKELAKRINDNFSSAVSYLNTHNDFDKLDRLYVLTTFINPLYADVLKAHKTLGIEMVHEVADAVLLPPYNHLAENIFANDFLQPSKYMTLPQSLYKEQLITLGKTLFFDPILSINNERSCASCHNPNKAFTDGVPKSIAMGREGTVARNAPTLINAVYSERYFHDLRAEALEDQIEHVIVSEKEFNTEIFTIAERLGESVEYTKMFEACFDVMPGSKINKQTISFAISAYVASLRGFNSPFDKYVRGEQPTIDESVRRGFNLFMGKAACGTCHFAPVFNGTVPPYYQESESEVLGVPQNPYVKKPVLDPDPGRAKAKLTEDISFYEYSFKTPTVRNVVLTAPYMHNGAYKTLEDVMDFYNKGGGKGIGIKLTHQTLPFDKLDLTKKEIKDIIAFMNALTDTTGMTSVPERLPQFSVHTDWNSRKVGGVY